MIDQYTKEELEYIVKNSRSIREVALKLGYSATSGENAKTVKHRLISYNIETKHFSRKTLIVRNEENVFCENSTATQKVLRDWYKKCNYSEYKCSICGQEPMWQGKELTLILDHKNGKNNDHRLENLRWVCPNCNQQLETTGYKKMRTRHKLKKKNYCVECGKEISIKATRCVSCENKNRVKNNTVENGNIGQKPSKNELEKLIYELPFTKIGEIYGVTGNAVRKWCKKYNLPYKYNDIHKKVS